MLRTPAYIFFLLLVFLISNAAVYSNDDYMDDSLGFKFGMSSKNAKELIISNGNKILKNEVDSKDVRTILFDGIIVEYPSINEADKKTRLEFYKDRLMSTLLIVKNLSGSQLIGIHNGLLKNIEADFGEFGSKDKILFYNIWTWKREDLKIILSTNRNKGEVKLEYTYMPIADFKVEQELEVKRKGEFKNPAEQMFKDGNYSQQGGPGTGRSVLGR